MGGYILGRVRQLNLRPTISEYAGFPQGGSNDLSDKGYNSSHKVNHPMVDISKTKSSLYQKAILCLLKAVNDSICEVALWGDRPGTMGRRIWHFGETGVALWGDDSKKIFQLNSEK